MAITKRKESKLRLNKRRIHQRVAVPNRINCPQCGDAMLSHHECPNCSTFRGRDVIGTE